jgi:hypothetical protein
MDLVFPSPASLGLFVGAALALLLVPGPAVLYLVSRSIEHGRRAGLISVLGIQAATLVHVAAAALGLSALLASSALAFNLVKMAGAAYLIWLGLQKLAGRAATVSATEKPLEAPRHARLMRDGFIVNLLNPKPRTTRPQLPPLASAFGQLEAAWCLSSPRLMASTLEAVQPAPQTALSVRQPSCEVMRDTASPRVR